MSYPIGTPGQSWGDAERQQWVERQTIQRSYQEIVVAKLQALSGPLELLQYGALDIDPMRYPLWVAQSKDFSTAKPTALITGGVHGYETSGVLGALRFLLNDADEYAAHFNLVVAPCISPWGFETINRWNPDAVDPNRSFVNKSPSQESALIMRHVSGLSTTIDVHIDLHETTDTDNTEFRPALAARDNVHHEFWEIPDGFYLVGDSENPCDEFQKAIINAVAKVTAIAPSDSDGRIIGEKITQVGVINYPTVKLGLCTGFSNATFNTTTEVYPDSPNVDDENCIQAQVAAVRSALDFVMAQH